MQQTALTGFAALNGPLEAPADPVIAAEWTAAGLIGKTPAEAVRHVLYGGRSSSDVMLERRDVARFDIAHASYDQIHPVDLVDVREALRRGVPPLKIARRLQVSYLAFFEAVRNMGGGAA